MNRSRIYPISIVLLALIGALVLLLAWGGSAQAQDQFNLTITKYCYAPAGGGPVLLADSLGVGGADVVLAGQQWICEIEIANQSAEDAEDLTVTDTVASGLTFVASTVAGDANGLGGDPATCSPTPLQGLGTLTCTGIDVPAYSNVYFLLGFVVSPDYVAASPSGELPLVNRACWVPEDDEDEFLDHCGSATSLVKESADLRVVKVSKPDTEVQAGETFTYTIIVDNLGPSTARNVVITDTLIAERIVNAFGCSIDVLTDGGAITVDDCNFGAHGGVFDLATIGASQLNPRSPTDPGRVVIIINAVANESGDVDNVVTVTSDTPDLDLSNNLFLDFLSVTDVADLQIGKYDSPDPVIAGNPLTYTLVITNTGPSTADNVVIEDDLPAEVEVLSVASSSGGCNAGTPGNPLDPTTCTFDTLPAGGIRTMWIYARVKPGVVTDSQTNQKIIHNDALVYSDVFDPDNSDNLVTESTVVQAEVDLKLLKLGPTQPVVAGEKVTYPIFVTNFGPSLARDVRLFDRIPDDAIYVSDTFPGPGGCEVIAGEIDILGFPLFTDYSLRCDLGDMAPGDVQEFSITLLLGSGTPQGSAIANAAFALSLETYEDLDNLEDNLSVWPNVVVTMADMEIRKSSEPEKVYAGDQVKYAIGVHNIGPSDAQTVTVQDTLPAGVTYEIDDDSCVEGPPGTLTCFLGSLRAGEVRTFDIWALVDPAVPPGTELVNQACVWGATTLGDPNPDNDCATAKNLVLGKADLKITKFGKPDGEVRAGEPLTYTVIVDNLGPGYAHTVVVTDLLQSSGSFNLVSVASDRPALCKPTSGSFAQQLQLGCVLTDALEVMAPSASGRWMLTVVITAAETQDIDNVATVLSADYDPDTSNNQAVAQHEITDVADLEVAKTAVGQVMKVGGIVELEDDEVTAGLSLTYTLVVTNHGPSTAENIVLEDRVPSWLEITGVAPSQGSCGIGTPEEESNLVTCYLDNLAAGASASVLLFVDVPPSTPGGTVLKNTAFVLSGVFDTHNGDNVATNMTTVLDPVPFRVYLPIIARPFGFVTEPDLVVEQLLVSSYAVTVTVKNVGDSPVIEPFWVDVYLDPDPAPTAVNQLWNDVGEQGLAWAVTQPVLALAAGGEVTLTVGDIYYFGPYSHVSWPIPAGTVAYAQVDSKGEPGFGAVRESHELEARPYNNILGPVTSVVAFGAPPPAGESRSLGGLSPRR
jgi:uncharacterized repeat protein (TIGR01451 family)